MNKTTKTFLPQNIDELNSTKVTLFEKKEFFNDVE
jgi:hypothetical protein